jgi:hypothetical protein
MRCWQLGAAWGACLALGVAAVADDVREVKGRVVDRDGKPVAGVEVASFWNGQDGRLSPFPPSAKTDADGAFTLKVQTYGRDQAILAVDPDRKRGGTAVVAAKGPADAAEIRLEPLVNVHGGFSCKELGAKPEWTNVYMNLMPGRLRLVQCSSTEAAFSLRLPPGKYEFDGYGSFLDYQGVKKTLTLEADKPDLDLGTIDLEATPIARHYGKAPPAWHVTDARGVKKGVTLADFKGKWVLIEFWGFW